MDQTIFENKTTVKNKAFPKKKLYFGLFLGLICLVFFATNNNLRDNLNKTFNGLPTQTKACKADGCNDGIEDKGERDPSLRCFNTRCEGTRCIRVDAVCGQGNITCWTDEDCTPHDSPTPTPSSTTTPSVTPSNTPTPTVTSTPSVTPTGTLTPTPTQVITSSPTPTPTNGPSSPVCESLSANNTNSNEVPFTVTFTGYGHGTSNSISQYKFDFGDGVVVFQSGNTVSHTYSTAGTFNAILTVIDNQGLTGNSDNCRVKITPSMRSIIPPPEQPKSGTATTLTFGLILSLVLGIMLRKFPLLNN